ncbi:MAG: type II toxin-antitoxin system VapC family toxin [SAR324 cluster bacterium]|nr:type II toxin-antitoxin system VapC family toxin [SAR324 cluster bacterium]
MIVLDTHIWIWWVHGDRNLPDVYRNYLQQNESQGLGISIISCWEIAKLVEYQRLELPCDVAEWTEKAVSYPYICLLDLTPEIIIDSTRLPQPFHRDPADQLIVATARIHHCSLMTVDSKITNYPHVSKVPQ